MPSYSRNSAIKNVMRQQHVSRKVATEFVDGALKAIEEKLREYNPEAANSQVKSWPIKTIS